MAKFLSPQWVTELDAALRASPLRAGDSEATLSYELEARGADGRVRSHHVTIGPDGARAANGPASRPDLVLVTDEETAFALHRNDCNAQAAIAAGRLRIRGDLAAFSRHAATIATLSDLFPALRNATTGPGGGDR